MRRITSSTCRKSIHFWEFLFNVKMHVSASLYVLQQIIFAFGRLATNVRAESWNNIIKKSTCLRIFLCRSGRSMWTILKMTRCDVELGSTIMVSIVDFPVQNVFLQSKVATLLLCILPESQSPPQKKRWYCTVLEIVNLHMNTERITRPWNALAVSRLLTIINHAIQCLKSHRTLLGLGTPIIASRTKNHTVHLSKKRL